MADGLERAMGAKSQDQAIDPSEMARLFAAARKAGMDSFDADVAAMQSRVDAGKPRQLEEQATQEVINSFGAHMEQYREQQRKSDTMPEPSWASQEEGRRMFDVDAAVLQQEHDQAIEIEKQRQLQDSIDRGRESIDKPGSIDEAKFLAQIREEFVGVRSIKELGERAEQLTGDGGYLVKDPDTNWFKPAGSDLQSKLVMHELEKVRGVLDQEGKIQRARGRLDLYGEKRDAKSEQRKQHEYLSAIEAENKAQQERDERAELSRVADEMAERVIEGGQSYEDKLQDYLVVRQEEARRPFDKEIKKLKKKKKAGNKQKINEKITELELKAQKAERKVAKEVEADRKELKQEIKIRTKGRDGVQDIVDNKATGAYVYRPKPSEDPDRSVLVSQAISEQVGKRAEADGQPFQTYEYRVGDTVMQRLTYKTDKPAVIVVEEWDKSAGILKSQTVMKGSGLLIPDYEEQGLGRIRANRRQKSGDYHSVLSTKKYFEYAPPITRDDVAADSGTDYETGRFQYAKRLKSTGVGASKAYEMAAGSYKKKKSKGFMASLRNALGGGQ